MSSEWQWSCRSIAMAVRSRLSMVCLATSLLTTVSVDASDWPAFRGPLGTGQAGDAGALPVEIGPDRPTVWTANLPPGHSSPVLLGDRVYITAVDAGKLVTIALDRATGNELWRKEAPHQTLEEIHEIGSHAQSSPVADDQGVVVFFGSAGLFAYDRDGGLMWSHAMGPFKNNFGAGSSPVIYGDSVLLVQDHDEESFFARYDRKTGERRYRIDRSEFPRGYATPIVHKVGDKAEVVVAGTLRIVAYDFETGAEVWTVRGTSRIVNMTPILGPDGRIFAACWAPGADEGDRVQLPTTEELIAAADKNGNGSFEQGEPLPDPVQRRFDQFDRNKDGAISRAEYEAMYQVFTTAKNVFVAITPGGKGEITDSNVQWRQTRYLPYCPSPVLLGSALFTVKNGGIAASYNVENGNIVKTARIPSGGEYYASPVVGDGKIYTFSQHGASTVLTADGNWDVLSAREFNEDVYATPAIADGRLYVRTASKLYCFAGSSASSGPRAAAKSADQNADK